MGAKGNQRDRRHDTFQRFKEPALRSDKKGGLTSLPPHQLSDTLCRTSFPKPERRPSSCRHLLSSRLLGLFSDLSSDLPVTCPRAHLWCAVLLQRLVVLQALGTVHAADISSALELLENDVGERIYVFCHISLFVHKGNSFY